MSLTAACMNSLKIGAREAAAGTAAAKRRRLVEAHVEAGHEVGREADEPGVLLVVGGAGLAGHVAPAEVDLAGSSAAR